MTITRHLKTPDGWSSHANAYAPGFGWYIAPGGNGIYATDTYAETHFSPLARTYAIHADGYYFWQGEIDGIIPVWESPDLWNTILADDDPAHRADPRAYLSERIKANRPEYLREIVQ